jgi:hypothetical protein
MTDHSEKARELAWAWLVKQRLSRVHNIESLTKMLAEALAACRLEEAKWWAGDHSANGSVNCDQCLRLRTLERAAGQPEAKSQV